MFDSIPGQMEERYGKRLGGEESDAPRGPSGEPVPVDGGLAGEAPTAPAAETVAAPDPRNDLARRVDRRSAEVAALRADLDAIRRELGV